VDDLVASGDLDEATARIFRIGATPIRFHRHQAQSIAKARAGQSFVVTTGTGSGKSLCFFVPVVDAIVRSRKAGQPRKTRAIIVYPMNALANSQIKEIEKFISQSGLPEELKPVVRRYTGQESQEERQRIADNPPDILLTNFMMAELLLTRQDALIPKSSTMPAGSSSSCSTNCIPIAGARAPMWRSSCAAFGTAARRPKRRSASAHRPPWQAKDQRPVARKQWPMSPRACSGRRSALMPSSTSPSSARRMTA
jgi:hypothetical protein